MAIWRVRLTIDTKLWGISVVERINGTVYLVMMNAITRIIAYRTKSAISLFP
jgi:hypothetical protein